MSQRRRDREPEVIVFQEPKHVNRPGSGKQTTREREKFLTGNITEVFASGDGSQSDSEEARRKRPAGPGNQEEDALDIKATLREVQALAGSSLTGKKKRKFEEEQVIALGAKPPRHQRMPYPVYQSVVKARKEREKRVNEELRLSQGAPRKRSGEQRRVRGKGRWKDNTRTLELPVGKFRSGVLKLTQKDITKISRTRS